MSHSFASITAAVLIEVIRDRHKAFLMEERDTDEFGRRFRLFSFQTMAKPGWASYVLFVFFFTAVITTSGQTVSPSFVPVASKVLSNSFVRCFFKDSKGYMWIGTEDGLIRYDGSNAYQYVHNPNDKSTIAHNAINTVVEGKDKQLWIGTAQGLCLYNRELDNFINVDSIKGNRNFLNNRYINVIEFDSRGRVWIGTHEGGINIYDPVKREFEYIMDPPQGGVLPSTNFINVLLNAGDTMWCASKGGLLLYDTRTKKRLPLNSLARFSSVQISTIVVDSAGNFWIAALSGQVTRLAPKHGGYEIQQVLSGEEFGHSANRILTLCLDSKGDILVGGENTGFSFVDKNTFKVNRLLADKNSTKRLPTNSIQSIYADDVGLVWIGTPDNGVFLLDNRKKKFGGKETVAKDFNFESKEVRSFAEDKQGNIWIGFYGEGLGMIDSKTHALREVKEINLKLGNKNFTSIICDRQGELWIGTAGNGVFKINPVTHKLANYSLRSEGFGNDQVSCLYEDKNGTVWAGTWGSGLFFHEKTSGKFVGFTEYDQPNHIPNTAYVSDILEDSQNTFWIGTLYGLYELQRKEGNSFAYRVHLPLNGSIKGAQIQALVEDGNKDLWVGTTEGLNLLEKGSSEFKVYPIEGGPVNTIRSMLADRHGNIWIGGNQGLSKFDISKKAFINYTPDDGLKSDNFQRKAALATSTGEFFFGSSNGFETFVPDSIGATAVRGKVVLSDLKINGQSVRPGAADSPLKRHISLTSSLELSYDQRSFVIDFVALDFSQSSSYSYCYKLEAFDKHWNCEGANHSATYTNIDPGEYVFLVKAANRDGEWSDSPLRLTITIRQVFWKSWWALCLYAGCVLLLIYILTKVRMERLRLKNEIAFEKRTLEQERTLSESKAQFFTNIAHEFRTPLSLIILPLEGLMGMNDVPAALRERIFMAYKNASRMTRLVNEFLDFNKLEAGNLKLNVQQGELVQFIMETSSAFNEMAANRKISFSVTSGVPVIMGWFDRNKLERVLFNVLSNAFKFTTDGGKINLRISTEQAIISDGTLCRCIQLVIEDNGMGILPEELPHIFEKFYQSKSSSKISSPGTGIGLSLTKTIVELHRGSITAESVPDHATIFKILLPIDGSAYQVDEDIVTPADVLYEKKCENIFEHTGEEYADDDSAAGKPKILIAEDNPELRRYLLTELRTDFAVSEATNGEEGLALALKINPDIIISDIMMPVKDGIEFCDAIKSDLNTSHIPFILLTAKGTLEDQIAGITTGADLYISKPFSIRYLVANVRHIIDSRRRLYARFSQDVYLMPGNLTSTILDQEFLQKVIDYIISNLQDPQLSVEAIAAPLNLSRAQFYRKIKALTGKPVVEFIKMVRMKQAIKLMDSHKFTLSEIAFEVGFNSPSYFSRCFKDEFGKTPSEYLEQSQLRD
jgi:signal transduction histidine kinase/ligand-binding sensor domain-containing protein/DNA-binding response OmpR family regulator